MEYKNIYSSLANAWRRLIGKPEKRDHNIILVDIKNLLAKYSKSDPYAIAFEQVLNDKNRQKLEALVNELYEQALGDEISTRMAFGDDLVELIFEYKDHSWKRIYKLKDKSGVKV